MRSVLLQSLPYALGLVFEYVLIQNTVGEMCGPGYGPDKSSLLNKKERIEMYNCANMFELIDFLDGKMENSGGQAGLRRDKSPCE